MIGIVLVGHSNLAEEFYKILELIVGEVDNIYPVYLDPADQPDKSTKKLSEAIKNADHGQGVLVLTDMFGGTPSNLSLSFLDDGKVEVLTGVNLPMLVRLITLRKNQKKLIELAKDLKTYGQKNICLASEILKNQN